MSARLGRGDPGAAGSAASAAKSPPTAPPGAAPPGEAPPGEAPGFVLANSAAESPAAESLVAESLVAGASAPESLVAGAPVAESRAAVVTRGLTKRFRGGQVAVNGLDMTVPRGSVYGFLGPNGSGKTTTIRMLLGLIHPTAGAATLLGETMPAGAAAVLPRIGSLVEGPAFHPQLSGRANLARLDAADATADPATAAHRIEAALDRVGLTAAAGKRYRAYSLGMKQRLAIAASLLRPRELVILDEPTNGLDPQGTREVRALIRGIASDGVTVLVSSHLLAEVEQICTDVGVMRAGSLVFQGTLTELRARGAARVRVRTSRSQHAGEVLAKLGLADVRVGGQEAGAQLGDHLPEEISRQLVLAGVPVAGFDTPAPSLEDLFVELTGEGFDVER